MPFITEIHAREVLDSKGFPAIECDIWTESGVMGRSSIPKIDLKNGESDASVTKYVEYINKDIAPSLIGMDVRDQALIDKKLMSLNKDKYGTCVPLSLSLSVSKAASLYSHLPLYQYLGGFSANTISLLAMPLDDSRLSLIIQQTKNTNESLKIYREISSKYKSENKAIEEELEALLSLIRGSQYLENKDIKIALNLNVENAFLKETKEYSIDQEKLSQDSLIDFYKNLMSKYPIQLISDPLVSEDINGLKKISKVLGKKVLLNGDNIFQSDLKKFKRGIDGMYLNSISINPFKFSTISELGDFVSLARKNAYNVIFKDIENDIEDVYISNLAIALSIPLIEYKNSYKFAKINELLRIEEELGKAAKLSSLN